MINFKGLFSSETSAIGLTSLGMTRKTNMSETQKTQTNQPEKDLSTRLHESKTLFKTKTAQQATPKMQISRQQQTEIRPLTPLFSNKDVLNFNNNTLLG